MLENAAESPASGARCVRQPPQNAGLDAYKKTPLLSHPNCTTNFDTGSDPKNMTYQQAYETKTTLPEERTVPKLDFANEIN